MHKVTEIGMEHDVLHENEHLAHENRHRLEHHGIKSVDLMGSIGSGKTALIIKLAEILKTKGIRVAAIAGDVTGEDDFTRMKDAGIHAVNCNTGKECHLDAELVRKAMAKIDLHAFDVLFVENVGNLVCPADFPVGTELRAVVISVTEGDDMVRKHPHIFQHADVAILNKIDIAEYVGVDVNIIKEDYKKLMGGRKELIECSVRTGAGLDKVMKALGL